MSPLKRFFRKIWDFVYASRGESALFIQGTLPVKTNEGNMTGKNRTFNLMLKSLFGNLVSALGPRPLKALTKIY